MLGIGSIWAQGLSGSAALQMATPGALQPQIRDIVAAGGLVPGGIIPFRDTIFLWQTFVSVRSKWSSSDGDVAGDAAAAKAKTAAISASISATGSPPNRASRRTDPAGAWLEHSPILNLVIFGFGAIYRFATSTRGRSAERHHHEHPHFAFLMVGFLLHGTPARLMQAVQAADARGVGRDPAVSVLRRHRRDHHDHASQRAAGERVRQHFSAVNFSGDRRDLFSGAGRLRAVGRIEVGDRSALRDGGSARVEGASWDGWWPRTISARRSRTCCSRSGCCRPWGCSGWERGT